MDGALIEDELQLLARVALAAALAAVLGWEREEAHKPAGLRTHTLVGLASALYTALGTLAFSEIHGDASLRSDPLRVIQAVAVGIGFLGSGIISSGGSAGQVSGLTTAASVWSTAAIGVATGMGHYLLAIGATVLQLAVLRVLPRFEG